MPPTSTREIPDRALRTMLLALSHQRALGRAAVRIPLTRPMVGRFVAGQSLSEAIDALERIRADGFETTVDVLGESVSSVEAAEAAAGRYLETLDALAARGLERNVSLKLTQMGLDIGRDVARDNVARIDMEDHTKTDATLALWREVRPIHPATGVVIQSALRRSEADVDAINADRGRVRLCKGAYNEPATVAYPDKEDVDLAYARIAEKLLLHGDHPAFATHDPAMINHAVAFAREHRIDRDRFEFQMLFGVRRDLQERLLRAGHRVRLYVPYGTEWYPYYMRRLAERPANVLFMLRAMTREGFGRDGRA
jgi:proline dehydrogenase